MPHLAIQGGRPYRSKASPKWPVYDQREEEALIKTLKEDAWGIGSCAIEAFEKNFASFCGTEYAVSCTNGTDAIYIAMQALGIGPGDEVIIPPYTFIATGIGVIMANAIPVFADIDPNTYNIDPNSIRKAITPNTKAIIPVHIAGNPANMDEIMAIAEEHDLWVMEDAAQAHGAEWWGKRVGSIGHMGTFSFQSSKNLSSGEGGAIVTHDEALYERLRSFVNCGRVKGGAWYDHHELGGNHRLGAFQAALLNVGLDRLEEQMKTREENAAYLRELLNDIDGVDMTEMYEGTTRHAYHLGILRYNPKTFQGLSKAKFIDVLEAEGIPCSSGYLPLIHYSYFQNFAEKTPAYDVLYKGRVNFDDSSCPECIRLCNEEGVWLFQEMFLGSKTDMEDIVGAIQKIQEHADEVLSM